jgi:hypothetical protein
MSRNQHQVLADAELARLGILPPDGPVSSPGDDGACGTPLHFFVLNLLALFIVLILPVLYVQSSTAFLTWGGVMVAALVIANGPVLVRATAGLLGSEGPRITAVLKAPDRLFCPRCGAEKTSEYCAGCGAHVETEYSRISRQLVRFVVEDTEQQRAALQAQLQTQLREIAREHRRAMEETLQSMEHAYVEEILRQRKLIAELRQDGGGRAGPADAPHAA